MRVVALLILFLLQTPFVFAASQTPTKKSPISLTPLQQQRAWYAAAEKALAKKQTQEFQRLLDKLGNYPLKPYLEYKALVPQLVNMPRDKVDNFLFNYPNSLLATKLTQQWLRQIALKKQWDNYIHYYDSRLADTELICWYLEARLATQDETALESVANLWNQGKSLPSGCDNIIASWKKSGHMTKELIWQRFTKAVDAGNSSLASFLASELPTAERSYAQIYQQIYTNPSLLKTPAKFKQDNDYMSAVILRGITKQAGNDAKKALQYFQTYSATHTFSKVQSKPAITQLALHLIKQKHFDHATQLVSTHGDLDDLTLLDHLLRYALSQQDWERVNAWLQRFPDEFKQQDRWRYWMARTMDALQIHEYSGKTSTHIYTELSANRSFYGFISAIKLQQPFGLVDRPVDMDKLQWASIESQPGFLRAREFFLTANKNAAHQEWFFTIKRLATDEIVHAAYLASKWNNHLLAIQTFSAAQYYDDLTVRFPIQFEKLIDEAAEQTQVDKRFIIALIRQESAFTEDIKSPANAYGLMQLLPSTAQQTAKRYKIKYQNGDLIKANKNIPLGSRFLKDLLASFNGNHILAAAAYNAGPGRVRQWQKISEGKLPFDIWVEVIPFSETRQYVQNLLAFRVIYAYRLGLPQEMLSEKELKELL
jgi:soluble lytic murein transglycosylase